MGGIGLALGGGGSRGAYQIGVWRALRELDLPIDAVAGTSIGAINGALMVGSDYERALDLWLNLKLQHCLAFAQDRDLKSTDLLNLRNANILAREVLEQGGLNTQPLYDLLGKYLSEASARGSSVRYGLMTATLPNFNPQPLWIDQIPPGQLIDFIMASARLPGLQPVKIDGQSFIDGGVIERVPISMLRRMGIRRIIAVDLYPRPSVRGPIPDNIQLTFIHDKESLGGILDLTPSVMERNQQLGYLDAMKALDQLNGDFYAFRPADYLALAKRFGMDHLPGLEQAAMIYGIDRCTIYTADRFMDQLRESRNRVQLEYEAARQAMQIENQLNAVLSGQVKMLKLSPPMKLAFLMDLITVAKKNHPAFKIPSRLFKSLDSAARALLASPDL